MKDKLLHVKKLVEMTTICLAELARNPAELAPIINHPQEFLERVDCASLQEVSAQEVIMKLLELNMKMRTELIYAGISYAKEVSETQVSTNGK